MDPYRVLYVHPRAPQSVIRAAYRALARMYHPDQSPHPEAERLMSDLNRAYAMVSTPEARAAYSAQHPAAEPDSRQPVAATVPIAVPPAADSLRSRWHRAVERSQAFGPGGSRRASSSASTAGTLGAETSDSVMTYGRYSGWRLSDIARADRSYLDWLRRSPSGRRWYAEIDRLLTSSA